QRQTRATGLSIAAYLDGNRAAEVARVNGLTVVTSLNQTLNVAGISAVGTHTLEIVVDPDNTINEGGSAQESNNFANMTLNVQPPPAGFTALLTPSVGQSVVSGSALSVTGYVRDSGSQGIGGVVLVVLAAAAAVAIGVSLYWKVYGLGKMVECGECGAFIPEDATTCPKCGVEFERDMAKCSNCQAWIPVDVKQCPECGVEFATGQLEMADYKEKMRLQYDEVIARFKQEASRQLGRSLSETEFQEWWRKQPTFLTFEDWLREEEEMRKMGSKPCPTCGTLNSVTATVCHKCGSLMRDQRPPSGGAVVAGAPARRIQARGPMSPPGPTNAPAPIVQKRVIKKPIEGKEGESSEGQNDENTSSDDL